MNYTVDTVIGLRKIYLRNDGILTREDILSLFDSSPISMEELEELTTSIHNDMCLNTPFALTQKEVVRFLKLKKAINSKQESSVCQSIASQLQILDESLSNHSAKWQDALEAASSIPNLISAFADKLPKLVKALNEYAAMCENYFASAECAQQLRANINLLPLAQKAHEIVEKNATLLTIDVYWLVAETLYKDVQPMFEGNLYYFAIVRDFLNMAIVEHGLKLPNVSIPEKFTLPNALVEEAVIEEAAVVVEEPVEIEEEVIEEIATEEAVVVEEPVEIEEEVVEVAATEEAVVVEEPVAIEEEIVEVVAAEEPVVVEEPVAIEEKVAETTNTLSTQSPLPSSSPTNRFPKKYILLGVAGLAVVIVAAFFLLPGKNKAKEDTPIFMEAETSAPAIITADTIIQETPTLAAPKKTEQSAPKEVIEKKTETKLPAATDNTEKEVGKTPTTTTTTTTTTEKEKTPTSFDTTMKRAKAGNADAQYRIGQYYELGNGVAADTFEAITWYRKAKANGSKEAEKRLAELGY